MSENDRKQIKTREANLKELHKKRNERKRKLEAVDGATRKKEPENRHMIWVVQKK